VLNFAIFDHLDSDGGPLGRFFEKRLRLLELIERSGFHGYHLAEHHATPLGMASSPSVFLASAIQRTRTIRLGLTVGVGRGGALIEHQRFGVDPAQAPAMYQEAFAVLMRAFETDVLDFEGRFYNYKDYLVQAKPVQRPHPPIWYGAPHADAIAWAAPRSINVVSLGPAARARAISDRYRQEWKRLGRDGSALPGIGITRHIVVAETDDAALTIAGAAYPRWRDAIEFLWRRTNADFVLKDIYPRDFVALERIGHGIAGSPATVRDYLVRLREETGVNTVLCQIVFGDMRFDDAARSIGLFGREIIPAFS